MVHLRQSEMDYSVEMNANKSTLCTKKQDNKNGETGDRREDVFLHHPDESWYRFLVLVTDTAGPHKLPWLTEHPQRPGWTKHCTAHLGGQTCFPSPNIHVTPLQKWGVEWKSSRWMCQLMSGGEGCHFPFTFQLFECKVEQTDVASCRGKRMASNKRLFKVRTAKALCLSFILLPIDQIHFMAES